MSAQHHIHKVTNSAISNNGSFIMHTNNNQFLTLEINVMSAQDLMMSSSSFYRRIQPFVSVSTTTHMKKTYKTRVDDIGGLNPTWNDKFRLCFDHDLFNYHLIRRYEGIIYLQLYNKGLLMGRTLLGWCVIPAADIVNQFAPLGSTHFLSYRLRERDGSRGHGVVNVAVRLEGSFLGSWISNFPRLAEMQTVINSDGSSGEITKFSRGEFNIVGAMYHQRAKKEKDVVVETEG